MSGKQYLIRASKQSQAIRMAVACHLEDVLKDTVDPASLDSALEKFYTMMDDAPRAEDVDLMEVEGDGMAAVEDKFTWSRKPRPEVKVIKLRVLEKQPVGMEVVDPWVINVVIAGNSVTLVDSGCNTMDAFSMDQGFSPSGKKIIAVPEELRRSQGDFARMMLDQDNSERIATTDPAAASKLASDGLAGQGDLGTGSVASAAAKLAQANLGAKATALVGTSLLAAPKPTAADLAGQGGLGTAQAASTDAKFTGQVLVGWVSYV